jgi:predicted amidohydrolase YtcJ
MLLFSPEELRDRCLQVVDQGFSLAVHAIGDRANRVVLDALEAVRRFEDKNHLPAYRHRIEHVQLLHQDDLGRLADLAVIASMQPIHAPSDREIADRYWGKRARYAYAWKSLLERDTRLAFGSDAPVENPNPFWGIHAAVTRRNREPAAPGESWYPEEALTRQQAIYAYTQGPAYAAGWENRTGVIARNRWADLIILDHNPLTCSLEQLAAISPAATMVDGEFVWKA